jgi:hypothetical protein
MLSARFAANAQVSKWPFLAVPTSGVSTSENGVTFTVVAHTGAADLQRDEEILPTLRA